MGKKGGKTLGTYKDGEFFCPSCAEKEEKGELFSGSLIKIEWEVGNQVDEEIIEFEEKWRDCGYDMAGRMPGGRIGETSFNLDFVRKVKKTLESYLQKPEIVEKSFGGKIKGCGVSNLGFSYFFAKSARDQKYRKEVVGPTFAEILGGGDPSQEINTISSSVTNPSDAQGSTRGIWKVNEEISIPYCWNDNEGGDCRYVSFLFPDHKLALQSFCRSLKIKEKELGGEDNSPEVPNTKICAVCGKDISNQETTYSSKGSGEKRKNYCSEECLKKGIGGKKDKPQEKNPPKPQNSNEKKGMSTGLKVFLGISAVVLVLILVIIIIGIRGVKKGRSERERERERRK